MATTPAKSNDKITQMFQIGYAYQGPKNQKRTGSMLIRAQTLADATAEARRLLAQEHDWFKIAKAFTITDDHPQQSL